MLITPAGAQPSARVKASVRSHIFADTIRRYLSLARKASLPFADLEELNLAVLSKEYSDEKKARELLEQLRWPDGPRCADPKCKHHEVYKLKPKATSKSPLRDGVYKCAACRKVFTVTTNTILHGSHIPISKWLLAIFILSSAKKSISAHQLHRSLGVTYRTAWHLNHRLRHAAGPDMRADRLLNGVTEVDETWIGGEAPHRHKFRNKSTVVALVERGGQMRARVIASVTQKNLAKCLNECVDKSAVVMTDEHAVYRKPQLRDWKAHHAVNHSKLEYARKTKDGVAHVNSCESFFSLLKRGVHGSWHHVSKEHLPKYANEFAWRWSYRGLTDGERMAKLVNCFEGKRLSYKPLIGKENGHEKKMGSGRA